MQTYFEAETGPLFAADFDYFRQPREKWELMLTRLKQIGSNGLVISVPWAWHEVEARVFDLSGQSNPRRDLLGLLSLCQALELSCILDTGPQLDKGIAGHGIPFWQRTQAGDFGESLVEGLTGWYARLGTDLKPAQWPNGPVVALIVDNGFLANRPPKLATDLTEVKWPIWLRKHYKGIEAINQAYGTNYRTVSRVEFPETWATESTPRDRDAKAFLNEMQVDLQPELARILAGRGWAGPIYDAGADAPAELPAIRRVDLSLGASVSEAIEKNIVLHLQNPIEIYPDPIDIGQGPIWAENAPVRADGSVRRKFWQVRQALWPQRGLDFFGDGPLLTFVDSGNLIVTSSQDGPIKVNTALPAKAAVYGLGLDGRLLRTDRLKISRKKLTGTYVTEDERGQVDMVIAMGEEDFSADGFISAYLRSLLRGQHQSLCHCAEQAAALAEILTLDDPSTPPAPSAETPPASRRPTSYVLEEARR
ncbi:MAG: beta-galactosidase, partial [Anaerolineae bacterium]|nr:beta-galactosidase [Anaerolineae bacterium]